MIGPMRQREVELAQFCMELGLGAASDVFLRAIDEITMELNDTRWWRYFKRQRLMTEWEACFRLGACFKEVQTEQEQAWDSQQDALQLFDKGNLDPHHDPA